MSTGTCHHGMLETIGAGDLMYWKSEPGSFHACVASVLLTGPLTNFC